MSIRRSVGAYEWRRELDNLKGIGEQITKELAEMGQYASTVEASRRFTKLVGLSSQVSVKALELREYKAQINEPAPVTTP